MWYLVIRRDSQPRHHWTATLDEHLAWMRDRHEEGSVLFSGPTADIRTGIYVIRAASREEAGRIAADDPFTRAGHCTFELFEWDVRQALGAGPFSTSELDAAGKAWRPAWQGPENARAPAPPPDVSADWTPGRMAFQLDVAIERYVLAHSPGFSPAAAALAEETTALGPPADMMLAREQYPLFRFLAGLLGCRRALDVGTFTGLSAMAFAEGMGPEGRVTTIDRNAAWVEIARRHWKAAGVSERIDTRIGEAANILSGLAAEDPRFDIVFLDVDKARVDDYFDLALAVLAPRGLVIIDNSFWHRWILDPARDDADTVGMRRFTERISKDAHFESVVVPVADGMTLVRRCD